MTLTALAFVHHITQIMILVIALVTIQVVLAFVLPINQVMILAIALAMIQVLIQVTMRLIVPAMIQAITRVTMQASTQTITVHLHGAQGFPLHLIQAIIVLILQLLLHCVKPIEPLFIHALI